MEEKQVQQLISKAYEASNYSYSPYSNLKIGAALLTDSGKVFTGANVENASFGATVCAERNAIFKAVTEGYTKFVAIAVIARKEGILPYPCGMCRQVMAEFAPELEVIVASDLDNYKIINLRELLTYQFEFINK